MHGHPFHLLLAIAFDRFLGRGLRRGLRPLSSSSTGRGARRLHGDLSPAFQYPLACLMVYLNSHWYLISKKEVLAAQNSAP